MTEIALTCAPATDCIRAIEVDEPGYLHERYYIHTAAHPQEPWLAMVTSRIDIAQTTDFVPGTPRIREGPHNEADVHLSRDGGRTWTVSVLPLRNAPGQEDADIHARHSYLWVAPDHALHAFVGTATNGVATMVHLRSAGWSDDWQTLDVYPGVYGVDSVASLENGTVHAMAARPRTGEYEPTAAELYLSRDGGLHWSPFAPMPCDAPPARFPADHLAFKAWEDGVSYPCRNQDGRRHTEVVVQGDGAMETAADAPNMCGYTREVPWQESNASVAADSMGPREVVCQMPQIRLPSGAQVDMDAIPWFWEDHKVSMDAFHLDDSGGFHAAVNEEDITQVDLLFRCSGCRGNAVHVVGFGPDGSLAYHEAVDSTLRGTLERGYPQEYPYGCDSTATVEGAFFACSADFHIHHWSLAPP